MAGVTAVKDKTELLPSFFIFCEMLLVIFHQVIRPNQGLNLVRVSQTGYNNAN